jgi:NTP pyrophosphatase (non-canonical NTP hydrolase)
MTIEANRMRARGRLIDGPVGDLVNLASTVDSSQPLSSPIHMNNPRDTVTFDEYQSAARRTMNARLTENERLLDAAAGIAEEAGEVLAHVRKHLYQNRPLDRDRLAEELGDVLWCVAAVATMCDLELSSIARQNQAKLIARHGATAT